jgi:hypothetical protein
MDTTEDKETKTEVKQVDSLYFVVRELDAIHKRIDRVEEAINIFRAEVTGGINSLRSEVKGDIKDLHSFMIKLTFSVAGLIIAGVGILFSIIKH